MFDFGFERGARAVCGRRASSRRPSCCRAARGGSARAVNARVHAAYAEIGLLGLELPAALGGAGLGALARVLVNEELAAADAGAAIALDRAGPGPDRAARAGRRGRGARAAVAPCSTHAARARRAGHRRRRALRVDGTRRHRRGRVGAGRARRPAGRARRREARSRARRHRGRGRCAAPGCAQRAAARSRCTARRSPRAMRGAERGRAGRSRALGCTWRRCCSACCVTPPTTRARTRWSAWRSASRSRITRRSRS